MIDHTFPAATPHSKVEALPNRKLETSNATSTLREERRLSRRAHIALRMRIRTADFQDGRMEQVTQTVNASRKGFYFHTPLLHYREGMRLRIIVPYHDHIAADSEEAAEVIRVDQKSGSCGVAVMRGTLREARPVVVVEHQPAPVKAVAAGERRTHQRTSLIATVDLTDVQTSMITRARTSDLSFSGCYVDTLNPLPLGALVELSIQKGSEALEVQGSVCAQFQGSGMGVAFDPLTAEQRELVRNWILKVETAKD
jgi:hypothetical protein